MNIIKRQKWSQTITTNVVHGTNQQRFNLLQKIMATGDRYLLAEYLIELMLHEDKEEISNGDLDFLDTVLRGDGWIGEGLTLPSKGRACMPRYSQLVDEQNICEFINRECTHERFFDSDKPEFQLLLASLRGELST